MLACGADLLEAKMKAMALREALAELAATDRQTIEDYLKQLADHSAVGYQAVENLYAETRLCPEAWQHLIDAWRAPLADARQIKNAIIEVSKRWQMSGPELISIQQLVFVRAVSVGRLSDLLFSLNYYGSFRSARRAIRN